MKINNKLFLLVFLLPVMVFAQSRLEDNVKTILTDPEKGESYLKGYLQPLVTGCGSILGSALYQRADAKKFPHFDLGVNAVSLFIPDRVMSFTSKGDPVPSVFGDNEPSSPAIPGLSLRRLDMPFLQLNLGLSGDFELMFRGWAGYDPDHIGKSRYYGIGVKYGLSDLLESPFFPINLSVQGTYHLFRIEDWFNTGTFGMSILWSGDFKFLPVGFYGGVGYDVTSANVYTEKIFNDEGTIPAEIKLNGLNGLRANVGISINIGFLGLYADYNFSYYHSVSAGLNIGL